LIRKPIPDCLIADEAANAEMRSAMTYPENQALERHVPTGCNSLQVMRDIWKKSNKGKHHLMITL
jgi:hypothetical protein